MMDAASTPPTHLLAHTETSVASSDFRRSDSRGVWRAQRGEPGRTHDEILGDFPDLEEADIFAALEYAAGAVQEREIPLVG